MSASSYRPLGVDKQGTSFTSNASPIGPAQEQFYSENGVASSVVTFTDNTTVIEVSATNSPVAIRWIPSTDTQASVLTTTGNTANFDDIVPSNNTRIFPIPIERQGTASIVGAGVQAGLYRRIAWKSFGTGSIIGVEF